MGRTLFAVIVSVVIGVLLAVLLAWVGDYAFPPPPSVDIDPRLARSMAYAMPVGGMLFKLLGWALGAFTAARLAYGWAAQGRPPALVATGLVTLVGATTAIMGHQPVWMPMALVMVAIGAGWGAVKLAER